MSMARRYTRVATDVGGTFTDLVCFEHEPVTGLLRIITAKTDTTPPHFEQGVLNVLKKAGLTLSAVDFLAHGSTVVINALTERKGAKVGMLVTQGFRDVLEIARGNRPDFFNLNYEKALPFVPRELIREVGGRMSYDGRELKSLDLAGLPAIVEDFKAQGVQALAISFLHSYVNPDHERRVLAAIQTLWPEVAAVASHQITREWREYERTNTAALSACVQPVAERYLARLAAGLKAGGLSRDPYIMQSNCGVDSLAAAAKVPITMVESGPASGFWAAAELGRLIGEPNVLALDVGGTTAKCSLIENGQVRIMTDYWIERDRTHAGYPIMVPVVDLVEIGNGGGSIAWVDEFNKLHVGPRSAGASPGPVAYGRGGTGATTTDANLWLGRINRDFFCGGEVIADVAGVEKALSALGGKLARDTDEVARGILRIANNNMVNALKLVSVNRGHDPRDFTLVAFGGGGGMHAVALASELGVKKVVVPAAAAVFSAWGMMMSELRRDYFVTRLAELKPGSSQIIEAAFAETEAAARGQYADEGIAPERVKLLRYAKFRYQNQEHTTEVLLDGGLVTDDRLSSIEAAFHENYEREYTYRLDTPVELVGIHLVALADIGKLTMAELERSAEPSQSALKGKRTVDYALEGLHDAAIYDGTRLKPGMHFTGPAIVEDARSTIVIHPGNRVEVDGFGNLYIWIKP